MTHVATEPQPRAVAHSLATIVGFLVCVEFASGILQGYYTPIFSDIADHLSIADADVNWFEAAQLVVSALCVPALARLGDMVGAKYVLLLSTAITAVGSWVLVVAPSFTTFLIGWAIQGAYVVWLPMEVAIVYRRTAGTGRQNLLTRRAAGVLVGALELSVIIGALTSGAIVESTSMTVVLMLPAIVVTACFFLILVRHRARHRHVRWPVRRRRLPPGHRLDRLRDGRPDHHPAAGSGQRAGVRR